MKAILTSLCALLIAAVFILGPMLIFPKQPGMWIAGGVFALQLIIGLLLIWPPDCITRMMNKYIWSDPSQSQ
jgi:hypothetical protein